MMSIGVRHIAMRSPALLVTSTRGGTSSPGEESLRLTWARRGTSWGGARSRPPPDWGGARSRLPLPIGEVRALASPMGDLVLEEEGSPTKTHTHNHTPHTDPQHKYKTLDRKTSVRTGGVTASSSSSAGEVEVGEGTAMGTGISVGDFTGR